MDALVLLTADHNRVRGLFKRFEAAHEQKDTTTMSEVATTIFTELKVHTTIEEDVFYPRLREISSEMNELIDEAFEEHHVVKTLMEEIATIDPGADQWVAKLQVLIENVDHHAEEEESDMFPKVRSAMGADELTQVAQKMEAAKTSLGAPTLADKIDLPKEELLELARQQEIPGRSKMSKEELAATVAPS